MKPEDLKAARQEMGLTQEEAARKYELSLSGYKKYELGISAIPGPVKVLTNHFLREHRKKTEN
jgi:transcriptional regulator with XRE-family HTH domain